MFPKTSPSPWTGPLRHLPVILSFLLLSTIITLGCAPAYGTKLARAPLDPYDIKYHHVYKYPTSYFIFYSLTTPLLTLLHTLLDLTLYYKSHLHPAYALSLALLFMAGWSAQLGIWTSCEISWFWEDAGRECYTRSLDHGGYGNFVGVPDGLAWAKAGFGYSCLGLYVAYVVFAAVAVHKWRKEKAWRRERKRLDALRRGREGVSLDTFRSNVGLLV